MAMLPCKRILLVAFILLCFISMTASARSLRESKDGAEKGQSSVFKLNHEGASSPDSNDHEVDTMDYTPAKKNPPIHN